MIKTICRLTKQQVYKRFIENRQRQLFGGYYCRIQTRDKVVALTFDDGPLHPNTTELLTLLDEESVKATFFMLGTQVENNPILAKEVLSKGHQIGNHSYSHPYMFLIPPARIRIEIEKTDALLREIGVKGEILFRAPYGEQFLILPYILHRMKKKNILFDFFPDPPEWRDFPIEDTAQSILRQSRPGSIIVLHDGTDAGHKVCDITKIVIHGLKEKEYSFITVSELLELEI